jgi:hypothetical protein
MTATVVPEDKAAFMKHFYDVTDDPNAHEEVSLISTPITMSSLIPSLVGSALHTQVSHGA